MGLLFVYFQYAYKLGDLNMFILMKVNLNVRFAIICIYISFMIFLYFSYILSSDI